MVKAPVEVEISSVGRIFENCVYFVTMYTK